MTRVTLKIGRIVTGKYVQECRLLEYSEHKDIVITFCCVFLQVRYSKITCCITLSATKERRSLLL